MNRPLHPVGFLVSVVWTLGLLLLGSVVHATESSLACPDWPTCFGSLTPRMEGGVFWEHSHRLAAAALVLIFSAATWLAWREGAGSWVRRASLAGVVLLVVQSVFGGLTVILQLPDAISTTHLGLAFGFLALATALAVGSRDTRGLEPEGRSEVRVGSIGVSVMIFVQSLLGAVVRHTDSGLACPDAPLCLGEWIPPLAQPPIALHYGHRVLGLLTLVAAFGVTTVVVRRTRVQLARGLAMTGTALLVAQVGLGVASVLTFLAVVPVSLHTLVAAAALACFVALSMLSSAGRGPTVSPAHTQPVWMSDAP